MEYFCCTILRILILWEIWKERCSRKYEEGYQWKITEIIIKIRCWIIRLCECYLPTRRSGLLFKQSALVCGLQIKDPPLKAPIIVFWKRPNADFVALNIDGASQEGIAAGGGLIRNHLGQHIVNFFSIYGEGTNNMAETRELYDGLQLCEDLCIDKVEIQTDSLLVVKWFMQTIEIPWSLQNWWKKIRLKARFMNIQIFHVYREGNKVADFLSKKGLQLRCDGASNYRTDMIINPLVLFNKKLE
ncbi:hypothetical protein FRX31_005990 [Thalictrum thalictroides]|uniref:RNase H type-1 domain-containing protein n=1 Tax=Thalictrum thalictroides TaxID=46969 RepID=A0A7J6X4X2_THATH|nr:hypothetical protein FRX31_005990 [Thalictrum thalictroides]